MDELEDEYPVTVWDRLRDGTGGVAFAGAVMVLGGVVLHSSVMVTFASCLIVFSSVALLLCLVMAHRADARWEREHG